MLGVLSGFYDTTNGKNKDIFCSWGLYGFPLWLSLWGAAGAGCRGFRWCVPSFGPLYRFALGALLANMALFRVLRGFSGFYGVRVFILLGCFTWLVGLCTRVKLGGLEA